MLRCSLSVPPEISTLNIFNIFQFITDGERPEGSPKNIRVSAMTPTELDVMWDEPDREVCHGSIIRYNIGYKEFG